MKPNGRANLAWIIALIEFVAMGNYLSDFHWWKVPICLAWGFTIFTMLRRAEWLRKRSP